MQEQKRKKKNNNKNKGITLITLVITIIVLLILAGISIAMLIGENGLLTKANDAKKSTEEAREKEQIGLACTSVLMSNTNLTIDNLKKELSKNLRINEEDISLTEKIDGWRYETGKNTYIIQKDGNVEEYGDIDKIKAGDYVSYTYYDKNANGNKTELFAVLYDEEYNKLNNKKNGVQIISVDSLQFVNLGINDSYVADKELIDFGFPEDTYYWTKFNFQRAANSYNNALETLSNIAQEYLNSDIGYSARCVGSKPTDCAGNITENINLFDANNIKFKPFISISNVLKGEDDNYISDTNQLTKIGLLKAPNTNYYWVASRYISKADTQISFGLKEFYFTDISNSASFLSISDVGAQGINWSSQGFRPVITLKSKCIIESGNGSMDSPYILK